MNITETITRVNDDIVSTLANNLDELVSRIPEPFTPVARRLSAATVEVVHQSGRLSVVTLEVYRGIWKALVTGMSTLEDELDDTFDDAVDAAERAGRRVVSSIRTSADQVEKRFEGVQGNAKTGARRLADEKTDAVDAVLDAGSPLAEMTKDELYDLAQELDIEGRSTMSKDELVTAVRKAA